MIQIRDEPIGEKLRGEGRGREVRESNVLTGGVASDSNHHGMNLWSLDL
jgi:hypothetical protein